MLADARKETIAEMVEGLISKALQEEPFLDFIPSLKVMAGDNNVLLSAGSAVHIGLTPQEAYELAIHVNRIIDGENGKGRSLKARGFEIVIGRRGRALVIRISDATGAVSAHSLTYSLAGDLQRQLTDAAQFLADIHVA